jgi:hypothetical protein
VGIHARQMQQHGEPGVAFDECANRQAVESQDEVAFPVPRHGPVGGLSGPGTDHHLGADELLAPPVGASPWDAQRPAGAQARCEFTAQRAASLDVEGLIDRLVRDPHGFIFREVDRKPVSDLFWAPRAGPAPILAASVPTSDPAHVRSRCRCPVCSRRRQSSREAGRRGRDRRRVVLFAGSAGPQVRLPGLAAGGVRPRRHSCGVR